MRYIIAVFVFAFSLFSYGASEEADLLSKLPKELEGFQRKELTEFEDRKFGASSRMMLRVCWPL